MAQDLWRIRRRKQMTIEELARRAGLPPGLIKAYELGQRAITSGDIEKLARALLVDPWEIKEMSDPPPRGPSRYGATSTGYGAPDRDRGLGGMSPLGSSSRGSSYGVNAVPRQDRSFRTSRPVKKPRSRRRAAPAPARPSQIEHLKTLIVKLDMTGDELLRLAGKPLSMLNRKEAAKLLAYCQNRLAEQAPPRPKGKRQRPYLPESVDEHELIYLTELQLSKRNVRFTLFNGQTIEGKLLGFSPYALTLSQSDGQEVTLQKLAVAYYQTETADDQEDAQAADEEQTA